MKVNVREIADLRAAYFGSWSTDSIVYARTAAGECRHRAEHIRAFISQPRPACSARISLPLFGQATQMLGSSLGAGGQTGGLNPLYQIGGPRSAQLALKLQF